MTIETATDLTPGDVLEEARRFFTHERGVGTAAVEEESETHLTLATFRSRIAISAVAGDGGRTRVRVSALRSDESIGKFLARLHTLTASAGRA